MCTTATTGAGVADVLSATQRFLERAGSGRAARLRIRSDARLRELISHRFLDHLERTVLDQGEFAGWVDRIAARDVDPYSAADALIARAVPGVSRGREVTR